MIKPQKASRKADVFVVDFIALLLSGIGSTE